MNRDELVVEHLALAEQMTREYMRRLPKRAEFDDLHQAARLGLIDAAERFDRSRGVPFGAYARHRIRGAMRDYLREQKHGGRDDAEPQVLRFSRQVDNEEIETDPADSRPGPEELAAASEAARQVRQAIDGLNPRWRAVLVAYYWQGLPFKEIGQQLDKHSGRKRVVGRGVNESRVSQMHRRAIEELWTQLVA